VEGLLVLSKEAPRDGEESEPRCLRDDLRLPNDSTLITRDQLTYEEGRERGREKGREGEGADGLRKKGGGWKTKRTDDSVASKVGVGDMRSEEDGLWGHLDLQVGVQIDGAFRWTWEEDLEKGMNREENKEKAVTDDDQEAEKEESERDMKYLDDV